jgi:hypothetical protein
VATSWRRILISARTTLMVWVACWSSSASILTSVLIMVARTRLANGVRSRLSALKFWPSGWMERLSW